MKILEGFLIRCGARVAQGNGLQIRKVVSSNLTHTSNVGVAQR
jgi:hypothetical protein